MANLDFYAVRDDLLALLSFIFAETDAVLFELSSRYDSDPRCFRSVEEVSAAFQLGSYRSAHLQLWSKSVMPEPRFRRIELTGVPGHSFRYAIEGAGLCQLYLDGQKEDVIYHTHFGHWSEAGAKARGIPTAGECDWRALSSLSGKIQRLLRGRMSSAKLNARPILTHAYVAVQNGAGLWFGPNVYEYGSEKIVEKVNEEGPTRRYRQPR